MPLFKGRSPTFDNISLHALTKLYYHLSLETIAYVQDLWGKAINMAGFAWYDIGVGQWTEARQHTQRAIELFDQLEMLRSREETTAMRAQIPFHEGRLNESLSLYQAAFLSGNHHGHSPTQHYGLMGQVENGLRLRPFAAEKIMPLLEQAKSLRQETLINSDLTRYQGLAAKVYLLQGNEQLAWEAAEAGLQSIQDTAVPFHYSIEGDSGVVEVFLALWAMNYHSEGKTFKRQAQKACKSFQKYARIYPIAQPRALLWQGRYDWLEGKQSKALKAWQKSLKQAKLRQMPYEEGLVHLELASHLSEGDKERQAHLDQAIHIFTELGAGYGLECAQALS